MLDVESGTVILAFDRISIEFLIEEFLEFCDLIDQTKESLLSNPEIVVGTYSDEGTEKEVLLIKPEDEDYN
jgi:hypothetical protein|tara:strand:+ start:578 stop:790 length:213 start_codon:yes stop_codon:yes gene_type:complete